MRPLPPRVQSPASPARPDAYGWPVPQALLPCRLAGTLPPASYPWDLEIDYLDLDDALDPRDEKETFTQEPSTSSVVGQ